MINLCHVETNFEKVKKSASFSFTYQHKDVERNRSFKLWKQARLCSIQSIRSLLIHGRQQKPCHQQPWYWPSYSEMFRFHSYHGYSNQPDVTHWNTWQIFDRLCNSHDTTSLYSFWANLHVSPLLMITLPIISACPVLIPQSMLRTDEKGTLNQTGASRFPTTLTHRGRVMHICVSRLYHHWFW